MYFGNTCNSILPPLARPNLGRTQATSDVTPLLPFHLLPGFTDPSTMDHVHKALIASGFGLSSPLKRKVRSYNVCRLRFNSETQISSHYCSPKHAKRLKAPDSLHTMRTSELVVRETMSKILSSPCSSPSSYDAASRVGVSSWKVDETAGDSLKTASANSLTGLKASVPTFTPETAPSSCCSPESLKSPSETSVSSTPRTPKKEAQRDGAVDVAPERETEEEKAKRLLYCSLCKVAVNSASQLQAHNSGTKHKTMLEARSGDGAIKSFPRMGVKAKLTTSPESLTGLQNKTFHCEICDVHVNSETQLKQHISSRRHKDRAAGKPAKPKFSPYTPTQRHQSFQSICLALQKTQDLTKPLASCLIQRQLSVAAAMRSLPSFPLCPASNSSPTLFQGQPLPQRLLHPCPGPICSSHTQVLFSPY